MNENKNKKKKRSDDDDDVIVTTQGSPHVRLALLVIAGLYLATIWLGDGLGSNLPARVSPRVWVYFAQIAALFKNAGEVAIEYRAEGWSCSEKKWVDIDVRPFFEIDNDTKENRFHRTMAFYRENRNVMHALEDYVVSRENALKTTLSSQKHAGEIGGVRFLSLRIPYPKIGEHVEPHVWKPLSSYPREIRHEWYWTLWSRRQERCGVPQTAAPTNEDDRPIVPLEPKPAVPEIKERR